MKTDFVLFGPLHLAIILSILLATWLLARLSRTNPETGGRVRLAMGLFLLVNELVWYVFRYRVEGFRFPEGLPLQLCDLTLWLTVVACLTLARWAVEVAYFAGFSGALMAIITPDLWAPTVSYPTAYFFLAHGFIVIGTGTIVFGGMSKLDWRSKWRALASINVYALVLGIFNLTFGTNYMYLCRKPAGASLLDYFGPWPVYLLAGEVFALAAFWLLSLPVVRRSTGPGL